MGVNTAEVKNKLARRDASASSKPVATIYDLIEKQKAQIARALPKHITADRFARIVLTQIRTNPKLLECDPQSLLASIMLSAQLGLEPGPLGHAYIVPYGREATFIIGYRGYLDLMWRSGQLASLAVNEVCENDTFEFEFGSNQHLKHIPASQNRGKPTHYYLYARYKDGGEFFYVMGIDDIEKIRRRSKAANNGPWQTDYDAMARKTVVRQAARWMPLSIEVQRAMAFDETAPTEIDEDMLSQQPRHIEETIDVEGEQVDEANDQQAPQPIASDGQQSVLHQDQ